MKKLKKLAIVLLALCVSASVGGCTKNPAEQSGGELNFTGYPIQSDETLTYWMALDANLSSQVQNFGDSVMGQELAKQTGVNVKYIHPPVGQEAEQLSILLSTSDLPDIIANDWYNYAGGPQKALDEQILIPLNDIVEKYAPNLKKYLEEQPDVHNMVVTDDGELYTFPFVRGDDLLCVNQGIMIRQDWLDDLNLSMPETIDEWHETLTAFKEKKGATAPLVFHNVGDNMTFYGAFISAYGITQGFFVNDGQVVYGPAEASYKDFLKTFAQWYKEGLIDENMASIEPKNINANMISGKSGATFGYAGSVMGQINKVLKEKDPNARLVPAPSLTAKKGEKPEIGQLDNKCFYAMGSAGITSSCKNVELAARFLDYGYSEEGSMLYNFGTEGTSYNMVDGYPTFTDLIMNNTDGLTVSQAMVMYSCAGASGPFVQKREYIEQYYSTEEQKDALKVWADTNQKEHILPTLTFTTDESSVIANKMTNIKTYMQEESITMIMGKKDIDSSFETYLKTMKDYGLDDIIKIYNDSYQRYLSR